MGYGGSRKDAGKAIGKSHDGGIDGYISQDKLGLEMIYIQAKRQQNTVGIKEIQSFVGALQSKKARKGVFITTSIFSRDAEAYVKTIDTRIALINGKKLTELMIDYNLGVSSTDKIYMLKEIDMDYFGVS